MLNREMLNQIKPLISDPGWEFILSRVSVIKEQAEVKFRSAKTFEEFLSTKGELVMAERIHRLFAEPTLLADDGIYKIVPGIEV